MAKPAGTKSNKETDSLSRHPFSLTPAQVKDARARARARAMRQFDEREHLRAEIQTRWHLDEIKRILTNPWPDSRTGQNELTQKMNGHFRMLNKSLPDLKVHEVHHNDLLAEEISDNRQVVIVAHPSATKAVKTIDARGGKVVKETPEWLM